MVVQCTDSRTIGGRSRRCMSARAELTCVVDTLIRDEESTDATSAADAVGCVAVTMPHRVTP